MSFLLIFVLVLISCGQNDNKKKELELKEREFALKERELDLVEGNSKKDTAVRGSDYQTVKKFNPDEIILEIRAEYKRINSLALTHKSYKWDAVGCANEGTMKYFFSNNKIVKIVEEGWIGDSEWTTEYYYKDEKFIFSFEVNVGGPANTIPQKTETRTYVKNDEIIRIIEDKNIIKTDNKVLTNSSREYKILQAYVTKDFAKALCD